MTFGSVKLNKRKMYIFEGWGGNYGKVAPKRKNP